MYICVMCVHNFMDIARQVDHTLQSSGIMHTYDHMSQCLHCRVSLNHIGSNLLQILECISQLTPLNSKNVKMVTNGESQWSAHGNLCADSGHCMCLVFGHCQHHHCPQSLELMAYPTIQVLSFSWFIPNPLLQIINFVGTGEVCKDNDFWTCGRVVAILNVCSLIFSVTIFKNNVLILLSFIHTFFLIFVPNTCQF
jgi:hypothetical protein